MVDSKVQELPITRMPEMIVTNIARPVTPEPQSITKRVTESLNDDQPYKILIPKCGSPMLAEVSLIPAESNKSGAWKKEEEQDEEEKRQSQKCFHMECMLRCPVSTVEAKRS